MVLPAERLQPERAPYGRQPTPELARTGEALPAYHGETYYGRPVVKSSYYRWLISSYFFIGGLAGAAQMIAAVADAIGRCEDRSVVRTGRYLAAGGAVAGPVLLIADLRTRRRWYNMFRIFRRTSPMSIGSWTLGAFGVLSGLAAAAQALADQRGSHLWSRVARWIGVPAAGAGAVVSTYTGTLIASTSTPLWGSAPRLLPALFGTGGTSSAVAALTLAASDGDGSRRRLDRVARAAGVLELVLLGALEARWRRRGVAGVLDTPGLGAAYRLGAQGVGVVMPLALHAFAPPSRRVSGLAAAATLLGGYALRACLVFGGNRSGRRPIDYFNVAGARSENGSRGSAR